MAEKVAHTLLQVAQRAGGFTTFLAWVEQVGLTDLLGGSPKYTVFAPTDEAFSKFPAERLANLNLPGQGAPLKAFTLVHFVAGQMATERLRGRRIRGNSVEGSELVINGADGITVNGAKVVRPDIAAANGFLHGIDKVLWPKCAQRDNEAARG